MKIRACCLKEKDLFEKLGHLYCVTEIDERYIHYAYAEDRGYMVKVSNVGKMGKNSQEWILLKGVRNHPKQQGTRVIQLSENNIQINEYPSVSDAARAVEISRTLIYRALNGSLETAGGYRWRRA